MEYKAARRTSAPAWQHASMPLLRLCVSRLPLPTANLLVLARQRGWHGQRRGASFLGKQGMASNRGGEEGD